MINLNTQKLCSAGLQTTRAHILYQSWLQAPLWHTHTHTHTHIYIYTHTHTHTDFISGDTTKWPVLHIRYTHVSIKLLIPKAPQTLLENCNRESTVTLDKTVHHNRLGITMREVTKTAAGIIDIATASACNIQKLT
jgi:hypothetical protein